MEPTVAQALEAGPVLVSAPCRVDMGGTLDLPAFHYPLRATAPVTVNLALDLRTRVRLDPWDQGRVRVRSRGFEDAEFNAGAAPYNHPLGMVFAICDYFSASGVSVEVKSASPPRSALGGSSAAAVAVVGAFAEALARIGRPSPGPRAVVQIAHAVESAVAGVVCGYQDQLAAAFGGVNAWAWPADPETGPFVKKTLLSGADAEELSRRILVAYGGAPHESVDINGQWVRGFLSGETRDQWAKIARISRKFAKALENRDWGRAAELMNREMDIRREMTPHVLDEVCGRLVDAAGNAGLGARSTGAGGGGCVWALGEPDALGALRRQWASILESTADGEILDTRVDERGLLVEKAVEPVDP
ncbi:MAG: galactokinase [Deltaproteobacteria bacterium]|nr:galactokinase [Deltaproteobacteria bacterium]